MHGFYGRILKVDLTGKQYEVEPIDDEILSRYLGGKGLASYLLYEMNPAKVDPLAPANHLIFATGQVTNSLIWGSSRYGVFTKSPQTGLYSESYAGGKVPEAIDSTGFDAVVVTGRGEAPTILEIDPDRVRFHDAGDLWGMDTFDSQDAVNRQWGNNSHDATKSGTVVIGPAGENRVRFAVIENDYWRSAGRSGAGAVMGSKNLKAVLFKGDRKRPCFDVKQIKTFAKEIASTSKEHPKVLTYKKWGTPVMVRTANQIGAFPTRYWSEGFYEKWENIDAETLHERCRVTPNACAKCFIACGRMTTLLNGRHAGLRIEGPEYETIFAFGGLCLIDSIEEIAYLNDICDRLGMDTISAGNLCGFAIEASRKKAIDLNLDYGDVDAIATLLKNIAHRIDIGDTLARGIRHAAESWNMTDSAVHVKGLEPPGYDPRVLKGVGLAFATADRGACHLRTTFHNPELTGMIDPNTTEGKAVLLVDFEDRLTLMDALILCRFHRDLYGWDRLAKILEMTTGIKTDKSAVRKRAIAISHLVRRFNIREGLKSDDDSLPARLFKESLDSGHGITEMELETMRRDYYTLRGWDEDGIPPEI